MAFPWQRPPQAPLIEFLRPFLETLVKDIKVMSTDLTAIKAKVADVEVAQNAAAELLRTLAANTVTLTAQVAALNAANTDAALQPEIDALTATLTSSTEALNTAITSNTPPPLQPAG